MTLRALAVLLALVGGCRKKSTRGAPPAPDAAASDYLFPETAVRRLRDAAPRDTKPLPKNHDEMEAMRQGDVRFPRAELVDDLLCAGDPDLRTRLASALAEAPEDEHDGLVMQWQNRLHDCDLCDWPEAKVGLARKLYFALVASCEGPTIDAAFRADDVPASALVLRAGRGGQPYQFDGRLVAAVRKVVVANRPEALTGIRILARTLDPRASRALQDFYIVAPHPMLRDAIAEHLGSYPDDPGARKLHQAFCARKPDATRCQTPYLAPPPPDDPVACLQKTDREAWETASCLADLAASDRPRAVEFARALLGNPAVVGRAAVIVRTLDRFPDGAALHARLEALGLFGRPRPGTTPVTPADWLVASGRAARFHAEISSGPPRYDSLLRRTLGPLAGLAGVAFGETAPATADDGWAIHAWADGWRYTATAKAGNRYDLIAVVGLLNHVLAERGAALRCREVETPGEETVTVACGPAAGLRTAAHEKLLE